MNATEFQKDLIAAEILTQKSPGITGAFCTIFIENLFRNYPRK